MGSGLDFPKATLSLPSLSLVLSAGNIRNTAAACWQVTFCQLGPQFLSSSFLDSFSVRSEKGRNPQLLTLGFQIFQAITKDVHYIILEATDKRNV